MTYSLSRLCSLFFFSPRSLLSSLSSMSVLPLFPLCPPRSSLSVRFSLLLIILFFWVPLLSSLSLTRTYVIIVSFQCFRRVAELAVRKERERKAVDCCLSLLDGPVEPNFLMDAVSTHTNALQHAVSSALLAALTLSLTPFSDTLTSLTHPPLLSCIDEHRRSPFPCRLTPPSAFVRLCHPSFVLILPSA